MVPVQTGSGQSWARWECPDRRPNGPAFLGKSQTGTGTAGFGLVQTGSQSVWDRTSPTLPCKQRAQNDFSEKDILDIIAKTVATALNDQEKQKEAKADVNTDF